MKIKTEGIEERSKVDVAGKEEEALWQLASLNQKHSGPKELMMQI